jgi:ABC-2 type transport system permease protein
MPAPTPTSPTAAPARAHSRARASAPSGASAAVLRAEARLFRREPAAVFWIILFPALLLTILGLVPAMREVDEGLDGQRVIDLYVPTVVLLAMIVAGVQSMPVTLTSYREHGILRRLSTTPARPRYLLIAQLVLHGAAMLLGLVLALVVGRLAFDVALPSQPAGYALTVLVAGFAALALGGLLSSFFRTVKATQAVSTAVFFPMMFTAGVYVPISTLPDGPRTVVELTPFGAASQALDAAAVGDWPSWTHLGVTALWGVVLVSAAARWFRWE